MPEKSAYSNIRSHDQNSESELKLEAAECKRHGYILSGRLLGRGAYAKVYLGHATQAKINTDMKLRAALQPGQKELKVAIKIICTDSAPKVYISKFLPREIATMNRCYKHMNVIQLYDMFATATRVYLILEFATTGDLLTYINECCAKNSPHTVPEDTARSMFTEIASGLRFIHRKEIAHRDLKCENVLLTHGSTIKLSDFGFAIDTGDRVDLLKTHCGSYAYASPEILRQQKYNGKMADLWSLGVVLFAMVNGGLPFKESDAKAVLAAMRKPVYFKSHLSTECKELMRGLLRIKPHKRLTIDEVLSHPWVSKLNLPDYAVVLKIPSEAVSPLHKSKIDPDMRVEEIDLQIKKQYAHMDDPSQVSKYLCRKRPSVPAPGCATAARSKTAPKGNTPKHSEGAARQVKDAVVRRAHRPGDFAPNKTHATRCFEPPISKVNLPPDDGEMSPDVVHHAVQDKKETQDPRTPPDGAEEDESPPAAHPQIRTAAPVSIQNLPAPPTNKKVGNISNHRAWVYSRAEPSSPVPGQGKSSPLRENTSPNVVNIRIDHVVELSSNAYNKFQRVKQYQKGLKGKPKAEVKVKCAEASATACRKKSKSDNKRTSASRSEEEPTHAERPESNERLQDAENVVDLDADEVVKEKLEIKLPDSGKSAPRFPKSIRVTEKRQFPAEPHALQQKSRPPIFSNADSKARVIRSQRADPAPVSAPRSSTARFRATTPSTFAAPLLPCKASKTPSPIKVFTTAGGAEDRVPVEGDASQDHEMQGKCVQVRPFSRQLRGIDSGEWTSTACPGDAATRDSSFPKPVLHENQVNPADAWQLPSKYQLKIEKHMKPQQLLNYRVKGFTHGHSSSHNRHSQRLPHANNPAGHGYFNSMTDEPTCLNKLDQARTRRSAQSSRLYEMEGQSSGYQRTAPLNMSYTYDVSAVNKLLYKRLQQPRRPVVALKEMHEQDLYAARSKKHFLPFPSSGMSMRKSDAGAVATIDPPSGSQSPNKSRNTRVVLKLHKS